MGGDWYDAFAMPRRPPRDRGRRRHRPRHPRRVRDGAAAHPDPSVRARRGRPAGPRARRSRCSTATSSRAATSTCSRSSTRSSTPSRARSPGPTAVIRRRCCGAPTGPVAYLEGGNGLMGVEDHAYETHEDRTGPNDTIVLYTDGLIERRGESLDVGLERLARRGLVRARGCAADVRPHPRAAARGTGRSATTT